MIPNFIVTQVTRAFPESMLAVEIQVRTIYWGTTNLFSIWVFLKCREFILWSPGWVCSLSCKLMCVLFSHCMGKASKRCFGKNWYLALFMLGKLPTIKTKVYMAVDFSIVTNPRFGNWKGELLTSWVVWDPGYLTWTPQP